ncbi:sugar dehydrogenase complex small subunit [Robbsia sp. KACC 23696]|uniref:sugar dehydrogenase complex small subunit n=1 Tax=Robbsia sp. KACC 23696 TaxID=3149231 RepID=UPI00325BCE54
MTVSNKNADVPQSIRTQASPARRGVLKLAAASVAVSSVPFAATGAPASVAGTAAEDFAVVSQFLTGKGTLDGTVQASLLKAFSALDPSFTAKLAKLRAVIGSGSVTADNLHESLGTSNPDLVKLPQEILAGWYLGVAGSGKHAICVTYANDLANAAVADVLSPPSYAYGPCNSWAQKPV